MSLNVYEAGSDVVIVLRSSTCPAVYSAVIVGHIFIFDGLSPLPSSSITRGVTRLATTCRMDKCLKPKFNGRSKRSTSCPGIVTFLHFVLVWTYDSGSRQSWNDDEASAGPQKRRNQKITWVCSSLTISPSSNIYPDWLSRKCDGLSAKLSELRTSVQKMLTEGHIVSSSGKQSIQVSDRSSRIRSQRKRQRCQVSHRCVHLIRSTETRWQMQWLVLSVLANNWNRCSGLGRTSSMILQRQCSELMNVYYYMYIWISSLCKS